MTALGTIIGFLPIAVMEAKFTKQQKLAEKISAMLAIKDIKDYRKFADYSFDIEPFNVQNEPADTVNNHIYRI